MSRKQIVVLIIGTVAAFVMIVLPGFIFIEENHRGHVALERCKAKVKAEGDTLDWNAFIPAPVPDDQNFYKAPKMAEWFVKVRGTPGSDLSDRLNYRGTIELRIADISIVPSSTNGPAGGSANDLEFRYSSFGPSVSPVPVPPTDTNSPARIIPVHMEDVPLSTVIEVLGRIGKIDYTLDREIRFGELTNERRWEEPIVSCQWTNVTPRLALADVLNRYDFRMIQKPGSSNVLITFKEADSPRVYSPADVVDPIRESLRQAIGPNINAAHGFVLLARSPPEIKPIHLTLQSETTPRSSDIAELFSTCFPTEGMKLRSSHVHVDPVGNHSLRVTIDATPAADYLAWGNSFAPDFDLIRQALKRPYVRIDGNYSDPFQIPQPNFVAVRALAQTLADRANSDFLSGRPDEALDELTLLDDSRRILECPPENKPMTLVSAMIDVAVSGLYVDTIANGLRSRAWRESQLETLQGQLKEIDLEFFLVAALKEEPAAQYRWVESLAAAPSSRSRWLPKKGVVGMVPGWTDFNVVNMIELERMPLKGFNLTNRTISPKVLDQVNDDIEKFTSHHTPYRMLAELSAPYFYKAGVTMSYNQTLVNEAQVACALERYRLVHGAHPETLDALVPRFAERLPHDIVGGKPLRYQRKGDTFRLYSVGWNELDDGGVSFLTTNGIPDLRHQDWVWKN